MVPDSDFKVREFFMWTVITAMLVILIVAAMVSAQPVPRPPQVPPVMLTYSEALAESAKSNKPLVVFVGTKQRRITGAVVCAAKGLDGVQSPAIVVSRGGNWLATLPATATDAEITQRLGVSRAASPFAPRRSFADAIARRDDDRTRRSLRRLIQRLPFLAEMETYERAQNTQAIYQVRRVGESVFSRAIDPVPRTALLRKWQVPGGLEHTTGWESVLLKSVTKGGQQFIGNIGVRNDNGYIQYEHGWKRSYADGTTFADVLLHDGEPFEVRVAEKRGGEWERYVAFRDVAKRPAGYQLVRGCAACHAEAGTGEYGVGLVPGGDTVISDPFGALQ